MAIEKANTSSNGTQPQKLSTTNDAFASDNRVKGTEIAQELGFDVVTEGDDQLAIDRNTGERYHLTDLALLEDARRQERERFAVGPSTLTDATDEPGRQVLTVPIDTTAAAWGRGGPSVYARVYKDEFDAEPELAQEAVMDEGLVALDVGGLEPAAQFDRYQELGYIDPSRAFVGMDDDGSFRSVDQEEWDALPEWAQSVVMTDGPDALDMSGLSPEEEFHRLQSYGAIDSMLVFAGIDEEGNFLVDESPLAPPEKAEPGPVSIDMLSADAAHSMGDHPITDDFAPDDFAPADGGEYDDQDEPLYEGISGAALDQILNSALAGESDATAVEAARAELERRELQTALALAYEAVILDPEAAEEDVAIAIEALDQLRKDGAVDSAADRVAAQHAERRARAEAVALPDMAEEAGDPIEKEPDSATYLIPQRDELESEASDRETSLRLHDERDIPQRDELESEASDRETSLRLHRQRDDIPQRDELESEASEHETMLRLQREQETEQSPRSSPKAIDPGKSTLNLAEAFAEALDNLGSIAPGPIRRPDGSFGLAIGTTVSVREGDRIVFTDSGEVIGVERRGEGVVDVKDLDQQAFGPAAVGSLIAAAFALHGAGASSAGAVAREGASRVLRSAPVQELLRALGHTPDDIVTAHIRIGPGGLILTPKTGRGITLPIPQGASQLVDDAGLSSRTAQQVARTERQAATQLAERASVAEAEAAAANAEAIAAAARSARAERLFGDVNLAIERGKLREGATAIAKHADDLAARQQKQAAALVERQRRAAISARLQAENAEAQRVAAEAAQAAAERAGLRSQAASHRAGLEKTQQTRHAADQAIARERQLRETAARLRNAADRARESADAAEAFANLEINIAALPIRVLRQAAASLSAADRGPIDAAINGRLETQQETDEGIATSTGEDITTHTGEDITTRTGEDITTRTGEDITTRTGEDITTHTGEDITAHTGEDITAHTGEDITTRTGEDITTRTGEDITTRTDTIPSKVLPAVPKVVPTIATSSRFVKKLAAMEDPVGEAPERKKPPEQRPPSERIETDEGGQQKPNRHKRRPISPRDDASPRRGRIDRRRIIDQEVASYPEVVAYREPGGLWRTVDIDTGETVVSPDPPAGIPPLAIEGATPHETYTVLSRDGDPPSQRTLDLGGSRVTVGEGLHIQRRRGGQRGRKQRPRRR